MKNLLSNKSYRHRFLMGVIGAAVIGLPFTSAITKAADTNTMTVESLKSELVNDPAFIKAITDEINNGQNDDHIRRVVKDYLIKNPEVMIEVQEALNDKQQLKVAESQSTTIQSMKQEIFNSPNDAVLGNPNGKVTLVEFFDYNCGYCKKSFPEIQNLIKNDPNLRIVIKDFPILGPDSVQAHIVARAFMKILPEKYKDFHKELLTQEGRSNEDKAIKIALKLGANEKKLREAMADKSLQQAFVDNGQLAYALNINGTPSYILGKEVLVGAVGENILKSKIASMEKN